MRQRSLKNQHRMLEALLKRFDAVDVTGMTAWERARAVHGRTAAGLVEQSNEYDHVWYWRARLPERKGQRCRVLARGAMNSILVQFEDGTKTLTSRHAVRVAGLGERADEARDSANPTQKALSPKPVATPLFTEEAA